MIREYVGSAETVEEATKAAIAGLNAPVEADVKTEITQQPQKKMLGLFGGKEAVVRAWYDDGTEEISAEKKSEKPEKVDDDSTDKSENTENTASESQAEMSDEDDKAVRGYITSVLSGMGVEKIVITSKTENGETVYDIDTGDDYGNLIGHHGETLDAIQYLVRLFVNKHTTSHCKVSINIGDYKEKRAENLKSLAEKSAGQVLKYGRNVKLEPMNPYERRIIHTTIQNIEGVTSHSVGYDDNRRVIISLEEGYKPERPQRRNNYNRGGSRGGYQHGGQRRNNYSQPQTNPNRAPHKDYSGSVYGKIEVPKKK